VEKKRFECNHRKRILSNLATILCLTLVFAFGQFSTAWGQHNPEHIRRIRAIEADRLGVTNPAGLAFSPRANTLLVVRNRKGTGPANNFSNIYPLTLLEDRTGSVRIAAGVTNPVNMAFDSQSNRLLILQFPNNKLIEIKADSDGNLDSGTLTRFDAKHFGLQDPQGMTVDPVTGHLFILDSAAPRILHIVPDPEKDFDGAAITVVDLQNVGLGDLRGLAFDPTNSHLHILNLAEERLYEVTKTGQNVANRDLFAFDLFEPQGMVFAQSGDLTDDPLQVS
jgi:uncharacterized protein YjiK